MSSADWQLDPAELASKFSEQTKAIVLNSPNNPLGKVTPLALLWLALKAAGVLQLTQPHLQCSSDSTFLAHKGNGCCGSTTCCAHSSGVFKPGLLCQQWLCPVRPLQPAPAHPGLGDGAGSVHSLHRKAGTGRGSEILLLYLCSTPCLLQVFSRGELELIADLCVKHDILCISDEVYEWLVYDGKEHIRIGTENGLAELRCLLWVQHLLGRKW